MPCPRCGVANNWVSCGSCGGVTCNSCGYSQSGMRRAANVCPYCGKTGGMMGCGAPSWGRQTNYYWVNNLFELKT